MFTDCHYREMVDPSEFRPVIVQRKSDMLTVVEIADNSKATSREIATIASKQLNFPNYTPDNASTTLVFHTESGAYLLGGIRSNPGLKDKLTKDGTLFPQQVNACIGGYSPDPAIPFRISAINSIKNKMFLNSELLGSGQQEQKLLKELCNTVEKNEGWEEKVCVHTDKWSENDIEKTMSVLTAVKHIQCTDSDIVKIDKALTTIMRIKKEAGEPIRTLSEFKFIELQPVITNSLDSYLEDEITKAKNAYEQFGDRITVTFNDLAVATLAKNGAFQKHTSAQLILP